MEDLYLMAKYNYMIEYLLGLYSTLHSLKQLKSHPSWSITTQWNRKMNDEKWNKMNIVEPKNFVHQMIMDLFQTVVRHALLKCPEKINFAVVMFVKCCTLGQEEPFFRGRGRGRGFLHKNYIFYYVTKIFEIQCPVTQYFLTLLRAPTVAHSC